CPEGEQTLLIRVMDGVAEKNRHIRAWEACKAETSATAEEHFRRLTRLLDLESDAEARQVLETVQRLAAGDAERTGNCLVDLAVIEEYTGLGGRCILTLGKRNRSLPLPWTRLGVRAPVLLSVEGAPPGSGRRGLVCGREERFLRVVLNEPPEETREQPTYRIDLSHDEAARQRQRQALPRVRAAGRDRLAELRQVLLGETPPTFAPEAPYTPLDPSLNVSQQE